MNNTIIALIDHVEITLRTNPEPEAFRELGLAIGLRGLGIIAGTVANKSDESDAQSALARSVEPLLRHERLYDEIVGFWLSHVRHPDALWQEHRNINEVMLATALLPSRFLSVGDAARDAADG